MTFSLVGCASKGAGEISQTLTTPTDGGNIDDAPVADVSNPATSVTREQLDAFFAAATDLGADEIRGGGDGALDPIVGRQYSDGDGNARVFVQRLDYAHLGIWITGAVADNNFAYANLANFSAMPPTAAAVPNLSGPTATYDIEADAVYRGVNFYPDGDLTADFSAGTLTGLIRAFGSDTGDFGAGAMLPDGGTMRAPNVFDVMTIRFMGQDISISGGEFSGMGFIDSAEADGFFQGLRNAVIDISGRFYDAADYVGGDSATAAPTEMSGIFGGSGLSGGFLGEVRP